MDQKRANLVRDHITGRFVDVDDHTFATQAGKPPVLQSFGGVGLGVVHG